MVALAIEVLCSACKGKLPGKPAMYKFRKSLGQQDFYHKVCVKKNRITFGKNEHGDY